MIGQSTIPANINDNRSKSIIMCHITKKNYLLPSVLAIFFFLITPGVEALRFKVRFRFLIVFLAV